MGVPAQPSAYAGAGCAGDVLNLGNRQPLMQHQHRNKTPGKVLIVGFLNQFLHALALSAA
ncbi:hypothetical protein AYI79_20575 [Shewanella algae]|nr:hypothetical protein AYI79_20575 [Shewanella algae]